MAEPVPAWRRRLIRVALACLGALVLGLFASGLPAQRAAAQSATAAAPVNVHLFWSIGCPHCAKAQRFLDDAAAADPGILLSEYEISADAANRDLFRRVTVAFAVEVPAVPLVAIGEQIFIGYMSDETTGARLRAAILACRAAACPDIVGALARQRSGAGPPAKSQDAAGPGGGTLLPAEIRLPFLGAVSTASLSMPALTVLLAAADGFNPCAMWVLVFLIGLLLGMSDHLRMWALGGTFLLASAAVYFAFMAAWFNLLLSLGALAWLRIGVGLAALAAGGWFIVEFARNPTGLCKIADPDRRTRIMDAMRRAVRQRSFLLALAGIVATAAAVNLIELLCSAGIPAIYTQVLALSPLPAWQHYLYLALYISVFLLDDVAVFVTAMVSLQAAGLTGRYAHYARLLGGAVLLGVGVLLVFRPEWLKLSG